MRAPLDSVSSSDWFVYHDWCSDMEARGEHPPRPPFLIRHIAEVLRLYEQRGEEPLLFIRAGSGWVVWRESPEILRDGSWAYEKTDAIKEDDERYGPPVAGTNPQQRPWLVKNYPDCCWEFFAMLAYLAISGKRA